MKQLQENWWSRELDMALTKVLTQVPQISGRYHTTSFTDRMMARNVKG